MEELSIGIEPIGHGHDTVFVPLDMAEDRAFAPRHLLDHINLGAMTTGLDWREIVTAVVEAERRTGIRLHALTTTPESR